MDDSDIDLMGVLARVSPQGPGFEDDTALVATGVVQAVDATRRRVTVKVRGGVVTLPAPAGRYQMGGLVRVLMDATAGRPTHVLGAVDVDAPVILATVISGPTSGLITVKIGAADPVTVPALPGAYSAGSSAWIQLDDWGVAKLAMGPSSAAASSGGGGGGGVEGPTIVTDKATVGPQYSGTYRAQMGRWDTWTPTSGWGLSDIYQGDGYGSGPLVGLACYGDQIVNLGALSITRMSLSARRNSSGVGSPALTVQCSPHGQRPGGAPSSSGSTASTGGVPTRETGSVDLPADMREAFRTGAAKGLCAVGGGYAGFGGTAAPGSFVLQIEYTRNA